MIFVYILIGIVGLLYFECWDNPSKFSAGRSESSLNKQTAAYKKDLKKVITKLEIGAMWRDISEEDKQSLLKQQARLEKLISQHDERVLHNQY